MIEININTKVPAIRPLVSPSMLPTAAKDPTKARTKKTAKIQASTAEITPSQASYK
jgi:hypothetical protein